MIVKLYSVCDTVAEEFGPIYSCKNDEVAKRAFHDLIKDSSSPLDYDLYFLGTFNTDTGFIDSVTLPVRVNLVSLSDDKVEEDK